MADPSRSGSEAEGDDTASQPTVEVPTEPLDGKAAVRRSDSPSLLRLFGSRSFFRLWLAQVVSSLGDWLGFVAVTAVAARIGGSSPEGAISLVLSARLIPGFFFAPAAGVLVDRWDRKRVMVACDVGRGLVLASIPFVDTVAGLFLASLLLEILTLLWSPAKEASVPNLVRTEFLANANSLSLVAAYGTFPIGSAIFAALAGVATWLSNYDALGSLRVDQASVAIWFDVATFFVSASMISTLVLPRHRRRERGGGHVDLRQSLRDITEGYRFIQQSPVVRAVILGLGTGLVGGGMLVPLGPVISKDVLGGGTAGFGLLLTALGMGVAGGIILLTIFQRRLPHERVFVFSVLVAGVCQLAGASMSTLAPTLVFVTVLGLCAGSVYILGFTILQTNVDDKLRGRIFATLYTLVRFCLLLAFAVSPILSSLLGKLSNALVGGSVNVGDATLELPGVRLTLWLGGAIILGAGVLASRSMRTRSAP
ncbi:MAG: MFS transporter [Actinomycetota bacterium]|nr:MFS transporter [Actinomycetota bacterium]